MGLTGHQVAQVREAILQEGQGLNPPLNPFALTEQAPRQHRAGIVRQQLWIGPADVGSSMCNDRYPIWVDVVMLDEVPTASLRHGDQCSGAGDQLLHDEALVEGGSRQHGMQHGDNGALDSTEDLQDLLSVRAGKDAELMLHQDHIVAIERSSQTGDALTCGMGDHNGPLRRRIAPRFLSRNYPRYGRGYTLLLQARLKCSRKCC
jgi:hypothetical protein